jgi:hypothetical protein
VFFFSLYNSFAFGVLFIFFAAFPYVFQRPPYSFSISQTGLTFLSIGIGVLLGVVTCILVDRYMYQAQHRKVIAAGGTHVAPEHRLYSAMIGSGGIVVGLFWFGWCAHTGQHWAVCLVGAIPFAWGNICLFVSWSWCSMTGCELLTCVSCADFGCAVYRRRVWPSQRGVGYSGKWPFAVLDERCVPAVYYSE